MIKELHYEDFFLHKNLPLAVAKRDPQPVFPRHKHNFSELVIVTKGSAIHVIDDISFPIAVGDIFVLTKRREHEICDMSNLSLVNIIFDPVKLDVDKWGTNDLPGFKALFLLEPKYRIQHRFESRLRISGDELKKAIDLADELDKELKEGKPGFQLITTAIFMQLLYHLSRCYGQGVSETPESHYLLQIAKAINYLEVHFREKVNFDELAKIACMSNRNFQRVFIKTTGCSARDHLLDLRLKYASTLLQNKNTAASTAALDSGFSDSNYFTKQFKKRFGITPVQYRNHFSS